MKRMFLLVALLSSATFLVSCGGGGGEDSTTVAAENLELRVDQTNGRELFKALDQESFVYEGGVPDFGTTTDTQVDVVDSSASGLGFRISSDGNTATGALEFGSCRFRIRGSSYTTYLTVGTVATVSNCLIRVNTTGVLADGVPRTVKITVTLNGKTAERKVSLRITANGAVIIKSVLFGTVKVRTVTGTGGSGS